VNPKKLSAAAALGVVAALAGAPGALANGAADVPRLTIPDLPFPADKIEHRVTKQCTAASGLYANYNDNGCTVTDWYITSDRDHELWRDENTGALRGENATVNSTIFSWSGRTNELFVSASRKQGKPSNATREAIAAMYREGVARGWYTATDEVRDGRAVTVLRETDAAQKSDQVGEVVVTRDTYELISRTFRTTNGQLSYAETVVKVEQLPRNAETEKLLEMGEHAGSTVREVVGEDGVIATAARKMGLSAKTRAQIAKKAKAGKKTTRKGRRS